MAKDLFYGIFLNTNGCILRSVFYNANPVASRMLRTMQQLSADAEKAGSAGMTLDEINAEIAAARSGK